MQLATLDWAIIVAFFLISIAIGVYASRRAGKNFAEYFLAGSQMSWWMLGLSMVATTFAADTPNLVTNLVREDGVSGNWAWWAFLLTGLTTVFVYAKLWKRSGVLTDLEFYEIRYSGKPAAFLRGFRAIYLGVVFNCTVMAIVILAAIKLSGIMLGVDPYTTVLVAGTATVIYTLLGGLRGVILTDCFQFVVAMIGATTAAVVLCDLPEIGGFANLLTHVNVAGDPEAGIASKLNLLPDFTDTQTLIPLLIIPLAVQWWSTWYPGAEPGGGGYIAQRMLSARSEQDATTATLFFVIAHYALRPWPWIIVALASLVIYPDLESLQAAYPNLDESIVKDDLAYPAMLNLLPSGLLGLVIASLVAAFMSTISTHLNWGSSYLAHDYYRRFVNPDADDKELVLVGRLTTVGLMIVASFIALQMKSALSGFNLVLQIGAGTGLIYILRWFWWRINAYTEIAGMIVSFLVALSFEFVLQPMAEKRGWVELDPPNGLGPEQFLQDWQRLLIGVGITTVAWFAVTLLTRPTDDDTLDEFYSKVRPDGPGWQPVRNRLEERGLQVPLDNSLTAGIATIFASTFLVYSLLFGSGYLIYGQWSSFAVSLVVTAIATAVIIKLWPKLQIEQVEQLD